jgi:hypothetical protein
MDGSIFILYIRRGTSKFVRLGFSRWHCGVVISYSRAFYYWNARKKVMGSRSCVCVINYLLGGGTSYIQEERYGKLEKDI